MKTRHKNIFKAGLQLCAALFGTLLSFFQTISVSVLNSKDEKDDDPQEYFARDAEGNLVSYNSNGEYRIIGK